MKIIKIKEGFELTAETGEDIEFIRFFKRIEERIENIEEIILTLKWVKS